MTPAGGISRIRRLAKAPLVLKEPACWRCSSLKVNGNGSRPKSAPLTSMTGVSRTYGLISAEVDSIAARVTTASGGRGGGDPAEAPGAVIIEGAGQLLV